MIIQSDANHPHNPHNSAEVSQYASYVVIVDGSVQVEKLLARLRSVGVVLSLDGDGRLAFDAPADVLTDSLLAKMRSHRDVLLALVEQEQAAIFEPVVVESVYLSPMPGVICPWCRSSEYLTEYDASLRCGNCGREAWRFEGEVIVRADWVEPIEVEWPGVQKIEPDKKRPPRVKPTGREQPGLMFEP